MATPTTTGPPPAPTLTPEEFAALPHGSDATRFLVVAWLLIALSAFVLVLRLYCKFHRHNRLWWDDHILVASWVSLDFILCNFTPRFP